MNEQEKEKIKVRSTTAFSLPAPLPPSLNTTPCQTRTFQWHRQGAELASASRHRCFQLRVCSTPLTPLFGRCGCRKRKLSNLPPTARSRCPGPAPDLTRHPTIIRTPTCNHPPAIRTLTGVAIPWREGESFVTGRTQQGNATVDGMSSSTLPTSERVRFCALRSSSIPAFFFGSSRRRGCAGEAQHATGEANTGLGACCWCDVDIRHRSRPAVRAALKVSRSHRFLPTPPVAASLSLGCNIFGVLARMHSHTVDNMVDCNPIATDFCYQYYSMCVAPSFSSPLVAVTVASPSRPPDDFGMSENYLQAHRIHNAASEHLHCSVGEIG